MENQKKSRSQKRTSGGEKIHQIADQLKQERNLQVKVVSRILGAAAQIAKNHDHLIDEVVEMVEEDIGDQVRVDQTKHITIGVLKQQFATLKEAKSHFGLKANSWADLTYKLNYSSIYTSLSANCSKISRPMRLDVIESELKAMRSEISQMLCLLKQLIHEKK